MMSGHVALVAAWLGCIATGAIAIAISIGQSDLVNPIALFAAGAFAIAAICSACMRN